MKDATERVFFALWPDEPTRLQLNIWRDTLYQQTQGRCTQTEDIHLTLAFLGDTSLADIDRAIVAAEQVAVPRLDLRIDMPAYWKHNRIVWAGLQEIPSPLNELVSTLREALSQAHVAFDAKPFVPHVTLIRNARDFQPIDLTSIDWRVDRFVLARSARGSASRYEIVRQWIAG
ncbi:MAG TPA: RNA 2',3'-cyclic phosphodiesterase [Burkholderiales bacterium]|nr:RNA 2',3'-cyclic phosphodiesterase [Burkholderiales bacterium]